MNKFTNKVMNMNILSEEEENNLIVLAKSGDVVATEKLVLSYSKIAISTASKMTGYSIDKEDLIQVGIIGIIEGIQSFDTSFGVRFSTHIIPLVKYKIFNYITVNSRVVKIVTTKAHRKLFFNLNSYRKKFNCVGSLTKEQVSQIATELNVTESDVSEMELRLGSQESSISYTTEDGEDQDFDLIDLDSDPLLIIENKRHEYLIDTVIPNTIDTLDDRQKDIVKSRYCYDVTSTLDELSKKYSVSKERIPQIEVASLKKIKKVLETEYNMV